VISGIDALQNSDQTFNPGHIEDRVSVIFYRFIAGQFFADPRYLVKLADPEFMHQYKIFYSACQWLPPLLCGRRNRRRRTGGGD
jgi:hypothetical protein